MSGKSSGAGQTGPRDDESVRASRYVLTTAGEAALAAWVESGPDD